MNQAAGNPTAEEERPRLIIIGLIVWVLLQLPRLIAIPLIQGVLDGTESDAWMFPAILDIVVAVAAPFMAVALWRARGLWVWVTAWSSSPSPSLTTWTRSPPASWRHHPRSSVEGPGPAQRSSPPCNC
jgi:hypothetical protein